MSSGMTDEQAAEIERRRRDRYLVRIKSGPNKGEYEINQSQMFDDLYALLAERKRLREALEYVQSEILLDGLVACEFVHYDGEEYRP